MQREGAEDELAVQFIKDVYEVTSTPTPDAVVALLKATPAPPDFELDIEVMICEDILSEQDMSVEWNDGYTIRRNT